MFQIQNPKAGRTRRQRFDLWSFGFGFVSDFRNDTGQQASACGGVVELRASDLRGKGSIMKKRKGHKEQGKGQKVQGKRKKIRGKGRAEGPAMRRRLPRVPPPDSDVWPRQYRGERWKPAFAILFAGRASGLPEQAPRFWPDRPIPSGIGGQRDPEFARRGGSVSVAWECGQEP
jgi:hypothetical protein